MTEMSVTPSKGWSHHLQTQLTRWHWDMTGLAVTSALVISCPVSLGLLTLHLPPSVRIITKNVEQFHVVINTQTSLGTENLLLISCGPCKKVDHDFKTSGLICHQSKGEERVAWHGAVVTRHDVTWWCRQSNRKLPYSSAPVSRNYRNTFTFSMGVCLS